MASGWRVISLHRAIEEYLALRRSLGFELEGYERTLHSFEDFAQEERARVITKDLALRWALRPKSHHPAWRAARLSILRGFARYRSGSDPRTELLPQRLLSHRRQRKTPHLYSSIEMRRLIEAARRLSSSRDSLRPFTYSTLLGLLACTGLRISEAISLDRVDFNSTTGVLTIRRTKFAKSRLIPLHASTQQALTRYARRRDRLDAKRSPSFFVSATRTRLHYSPVLRTFAKIIKVQAGVHALAGRREPRLHDFRHGFAIKTVLRWYRTGRDVEALLPRLSTYLGHARVSDTYWYLSATPELLALLGRRLERTLGDLP